MGRPKKVYTAEELAAKEKQKSDKKRKHKSLEERQKINLEKHKKRMQERESTIKTRSQEKFYVRNKDLMEELLKWKNAPMPKDGIKPVHPELCVMLRQIAQKLINHSNFSGYSFDMKQDMISFALYREIKALIKGKYNFEFQNPFAYFTSVVWNSYLIKIGEHYRQINITKDLIAEKRTELEAAGYVDSRKLYNEFLKQYLGDIVANSEIESLDDARNEEAEN